VETSEFPLTMVGTDGRGISDAGMSGEGAAGGSAERGSAIVKAGGREIKAKDAAAEEQPGSQNVTPGPEGGVK